MALPNGVCKPFVDAINEAGKPEAVIVDLSADYRFDSSWTYGLPELVDRRVCLPVSGVVGGQGAAVGQRTGDEWAV